MVKLIKKIPAFIKEVKDELGKVNWSTRHELITAGIIVVVASAMLTSYIFFVDVGLAQALKFILQ